MNEWLFSMSLSHQLPFTPPSSNPWRLKHMHASLEAIPVDQHASRDGCGGGRSILHVKLPLYVVPGPLKWISGGRG